jgi:hypothetical protein
VDRVICQTVEFRTLIEAKSRVGSLLRIFPDPATGGPVPADSLPRLRLQLFSRILPGIGDTFRREAQMPFRLLN